MIPSGKIILAFLLAASSAMAQNWLGVRVGMINYAEGIFYIDQDPLQLPEARFREVPRGSRLRTGNGWVEVQLGPNAYLWMGENSVLRMEDPSLTNIQLLVEQGSVLFEVSELAKKNNIRIRFGESIIEPRQAGVYRLDSGKSLLRVYAGKAEIRRASNKATVKQGKAALLTGNLKTSKFDVRQTDRLQEIAAQRSQILGRVILEARARANRRPTGETDRWPEARQMQTNEQPRDMNPQGISDSQSITTPASWPGQQEGHQPWYPPEMLQAIQDANDKARSGQ